MNQALYAHMNNKRKMKKKKKKEGGVVVVHVGSCLSVNKDISLFYAYCCA
jgi:hypothetical protein